VFLHFMFLWISCLAYKCYEFFSKILRLIWSKQFVFSKPKVSSPKTLMNRYLMQPAMEMVLYWYLTSKDSVERIQSKLSAWKNRQFFCSRKSRFFFLLKWWWLMERLSQWLPDNCVQVILLICLPCLDNGSVEPWTRWWILILCFYMN